MSEFITLEKGNKNFQAYLLGTFSNDKLALPVRSYNPNSSNERITFRLILKEKRVRPHWFIIAAQLFRVELLGLSLLPILVTFALLWSESATVNWGFAGLAFLVTAFFHGAAFTYNDYSDHLRGVDRVGVDSGSRVIQNAWLTASQVKKVSYSLMVIGVLLSGPIIFAMPWHSLVVAGGVGLGVLGYSFSGSGFRAWGLGPTLISICLGPLLTYGVSFTIVQSVPISVLYLGVYFGFLAALYLQLRHFERIMADDQAGVSTLMSRLGFDRSKKFILVQVPLVLVFYSLLVYLNAWPETFYFGLLPLGLTTLSLMIRVLKCQSPLSSSLEGLRFDGTRLQLIAGFVIFLLLLS